MGQTGKSVLLKDTLEEGGDGRVDLDGISVSQEVMRIVRDYQLFEWHAGFFQTPDQIGGLVESDVAIVVAVDQKYRGFPGGDG